MVIFTFLSFSLACLVIYMNLTTWRFRLLWLAVAVASLFPLTGLWRILGPFAVVVILSLYQSIKNRGLEEED